MGQSQFAKRFSRDVLLVEDDDDFREGLADILRSEGYSVRCARNGLEALDYLRSAENPPGVILLDLMMPVMNGWDLRKHMLAESALADIPVILLSAAHDLNAAPLQAAGALHKPIELSQLLRTIEGTLLDTCAACRGPIRDARHTVIVRGAVAAALCDACKGAEKALEGELHAVLDRFAERRRAAT